MSNITINADSIYNREIRIGRQTENLVSEITFNVNMWVEKYGAGECVLNVRRNGDRSAYPVPMTITDGLTTWTITDTDTEKKGRGEIQLVYRAGDKVKTSPMFTINCGKSLIGDGEPPSGYEDWLAELGEMTAQVEAAKTSASASAQTAQTAAGTAVEKASEAEQSANTASGFAVNASASATSASTSAQVAAQAASQAAESVSDVEASAQAASQSAQSAESARQAAQTAEINAQAFAQTASEKASQAAESAAQAQESATDAQSEADRAKTYADRAEEVELEIPTKVSQLENDAGYLTEHQSLDDYVLKDVLYNILPTDSASGAVASFPDGADDIPVKSLVVGIDPVQDLHGYENPWPAGGGVNKLNPAEMRTSGTVYGLTISIDGEDFVISGTYNGSVINPQFRFAQYTDRREIPYHCKGFAVDAITANHYNSFVGKADSNKTLTIQFNNCVQGETYNFRVRIVAYEGSTAPTAWTPYANICPITGWTGANITRTGKNLLNYPYEDIHLNQPNSNRGFVFHCKIPVTCTFSFTASSDYANSNNYWLVYIAKGTTKTYITPIAGTTVSKTIVTSPDDPITEIYIRSAGITAGSVSNLQLELGSTATEYEPYQGETYDIAFPTEAGTVYGGALDVLTGVLTVDRAYVDLGTLNWSKNEDRFTVATKLIPNPKSVSVWDADNPMAICSAYKYGNIGNNNGVDKAIGFYAGYLYARDIAYENAGDFKNGCSGVQLVYELATPITYQLTPHEVKSLLGYNNIWADTGDTVVEYRADIQRYIGKRLSS